MVVALLLAGLARAEDVYVSSNVKGAAILLNGVDTGLVTPATVAGVAPGTVLIAVEGACARGETLIDVKRGTPTRASVLAHEMMGTLTVQPKPLQAELELDGKPYPGAPGTPVALECGSHALRASLDGYVPAVVTIDLGMGQDLVIPLTLQKLGLATLELTVQPRNAEILLDGKRVGVDAVTLPSVYQGPHTIAAELDGYQTAKKQILVEEGQTYAFHFELERTSKKSRNSRVIQIGGAKAGTTESAGAADAVEASPAVADAADADADRREREEAARREREEAARREREEAARREREEAEEAEAREAEEAEAREAEIARREREEAEAEEAARREREAIARREREEALAREEAEEAARREEEERLAEEEAERAADKARAKAEAEAREEARRREEAEARKAADAERREEAARRRARADGTVGKTVGGAGLLALGAAGGVGTVLAFDSTSQAYVAYEAKVDAARGDRLQQKKADEYYDQTVVPRRNLMYAAGAGTALFLAGGVTVLLLDEGGPTLAPVPGGAMLGYTVSF